MLGFWRHLVFITKKTHSTTTLLPESGMAANIAGFSHTVVMRKYHGHHRCMVLMKYIRFRLTGRCHGWLHSERWEMGTEIMEIS